MNHTIINYIVLSLNAFFLIGSVAICILKYRRISMLPNKYKVLYLKPILFSLGFNIALFITCLLFYLRVTTELFAFCGTTTLFFSFLSIANLFSEENSIG